MELAEAERDAGTKCDGVTGARVGVQEVQVLAGDLTWLRTDEMAPLTTTWQELIRPFSEM